jgi:hypothetical protein
VVQVTSLESGGSISASTSLSLSIEGVCSELVHTLWFRFSRGCVARVSNGHFSVIRVMHCLIKTCLLVPYTQTGCRRKREGVSARTWGINRTLSKGSKCRSQVETDNEELRLALLPRVSRTSRALGSPLLEPAWLPRTQRSQGILVFSRRL